MKARFSLFSRILLWFLLSFFLIGAIVFAFFLLHVRMDPESPLRGKSASRLRSTVRLISQELNEAPRAQWDAILARWTEAYNVTFTLYSPHGMHLAGTELPLPQEVSELMGRHAKFFIRTSRPVRYWMGLPIRLSVRQAVPPRPGILVMMSDPKVGAALFSDPLPWVGIVAVVLVLSVLLWFPLVRNLTRPIAQITEATERIARGRFDVRVAQDRSDEIGRLGRAINDMAARLTTLVDGQKRFLGDVSHELRSPLARIQLALELLEQTADDKQRAYIRDGLEEVEQMSGLVGELLSVARAEVNPGKVKRRAVELEPVAARVARREGAGATEIRVDVDPGIRVAADPELLARALANLLRNAVRYAGTAGPVELRARRVDRKVRIEVTDAGPGVPQPVLARLFEPFYRPESDRDRDTGGSGLGLAIVKTCAEACGGSVSARNLEPSGFAVTLVLDVPETKPTDF